MSFYKLHLGFTVGDDEGFCSKHIVINLVGNPRFVLWIFMEGSNTDIADGKVRREVGCIYPGYVADPSIQIVAFHLFVEPFLVLLIDRTDKKKING